MKWPLTFYVDSLSDGFQGKTNGPFIRILKSSKDDEGLYQHELEHVRQWFFTFGLFSLLYLFPRFRLWVEVQAYKVQAKYYKGDKIPLFATFIAEKYKLNITASNTEKLLREK